MTKIVFENDELLVMAMFDGGTQRRTMDQIEEILPHVQDDDEVFPLAINTLNKLKQISEAEYLSLDLESYKQEPEESV